MLCLLLSQEIEDEDAEEEDEIRSEPPQISKKEAPTANVSKSKKKSKGKRKGKSSTVSASADAAEEESVDELLERLALQNEGSVSTSDSATAAGTSLHQANNLQHIELQACYELWQSILWLVGSGQGFMVIKMTNSIDHILLFMWGQILHRQRTLRVLVKKQ